MRSKSQIIMEKIITKPNENDCKLHENIQNELKSNTIWVEDHETRLKHFKSLKNERLKRFKSRPTSPDMGPSSVNQTLKLDFGFANADVENQHKSGVYENINLQMQKLEEAESEWLKMKKNMRNSGDFGRSNSKEKLKLTGRKSAINFRKEKLEPQDKRRFQEIQPHQKTTIINLKQQQVKEPIEKTKKLLDMILEVKADLDKYSQKSYAKPISNKENNFTLKKSSGKNTQRASRKTTIYKENTENLSIKKTVKKNVTLMICEAENSGLLNTRKKLNIFNEIDENLPFEEETIKKPKESLKPNNFLNKNMQNAIYSKNTNILRENYKIGLKLNKLPSKSKIVTGIFYSIILKGGIKGRNENNVTINKSKGKLLDRSNKLNINLKNAGSKTRINSKSRIENLQNIL